MYVYWVNNGKRVPVLQEKRREQYRRRVESGKAAEYYEKTKAARKAKMDADKEACRAEDRANGVYYMLNAPKGKEDHLCSGQGQADDPADGAL